MSNGLLPGTIRPTTPSPLPPSKLMGLAIMQRHTQHPSVPWGPYLHSQAWVSLLWHPFSEDSSPAFPFFSLSLPGFANCCTFWKSKHTAPHSPFSEPLKDETETWFVKEAACSWIPISCSSLGKSYAMHHGWILILVHLRRCHLPVVLNRCQAHRPDASLSDKDDENWWLFWVSPMGMPCDQWLFFLKWGGHCFKIQLLQGLLIQGQGLSLA